MISLKLSIWQLIIYFGIANTLVLAALLLFSHKNKKASILLALLLIVVSINYLDMEGFSYLYRKIDWYYINRISLEYTFGFLYVFYVRSLLQLNFKLSKNDLSIVLPFVCTIVYDIIRAIYVANWIPFTQKIDYLYIQNEFLLLEGPAILLMLYCYYLSFKYINDYQKSIKSSFSSLNKRTLGWLKFLTVFASINTFIWLGYYIVELLIYPKILSFQDYYPLWCYTILLLMIMGYKNLMQPELMDTLKIIVAGSDEKYKTSKLSKVDILQLCDIITKKVKSRHLHRKSDLNLNEFSQQVDIPSHQVSQAINQGLKMTFYDFINYYRVEEIKIRLNNKEADQFTLLALALEAGFNNKNSFNKAFKKFTGHTPSDYRKLNRK